MTRRQPTLICVAAAISATVAMRPACSQQSAENFTYRSPGTMTFAGDVGVKDRRVFYPTMKFPLRVGPEAGADGRPLRAFANSQVFIPSGFATNDPRLYVYPWVDTLCESKHKGGPMPVCPNPRHRGHQGDDIRPNSPADNTYDILAWADGIVTDVSSSLSGTTEVNIRSADNNGLECVYLHLRPGNLHLGQTVTKGDPIGKVSNLMADGGTSIHLHFECKATHPDLQAKVKMPIYTSLVAAYRREWRLPDIVENGALSRDPEREMEPGAPTQPDPSCGEPLSAPLVAEKDRRFDARYSHNCSEMGLAADPANQKMELVYVRPKQSLQQAAQRDPVLLSGKLAATGDFTGEAVNFNAACGDPKFGVAGKVDLNDTEIVLQGDRHKLDGRCNPTGVQHEVLRFAKLGGSSTPPTPDPLPLPGELNCPFALPPGQQPVVVDGREIPPKSERSCNFTALTVPGNVSFDQMPRYLRNWPGVRTDVLIDKSEDQIITFQTAESGIGAWWYWLTVRAVNGAGLTKRGFGTSGKPTWIAVARGIAGGERSEEFVRKTYLAPYLSFASEFFGRVMTENEQLDLSNADVRWNLARTMFRLESGRTPVVVRKQFECGVALGNDVLSDFTRAGVETSAPGPVTFQTFKGLLFYVRDCSGPVEPTNPSAPADVLAKLEQASQQIQALTTRVAGLQQDVADREQKLQAANQQISGLQRRIVELTSARPVGPPDPTSMPSDAAPATRVEVLQQTLQLTNQMFETQRQICQLNENACNVRIPVAARKKLASSAVSSACAADPAACRAKHRIPAHRFAFVRTFVVARAHR